MSRRLALLLTTAVLAVGAVPTHAARPAVCRAAFPDASGDADAPSPALYRPAATPGVDIQQLTVSSDRERLTASITVGDISRQPASSTSTRVAFEFVLQKWDFTVFHAVQPLPDAAASKVDHTHGIEVFGEFESDDVDVTVDGNTVILSVTYDVLQRIRHKPVVGQRISGLQATTTTYYVPDLRVGLYPHQQYDVTEATARAVRVLGGPCGSR